MRLLAALLLAAFQALAPASAQELPAVSGQDDRSLTINYVAGERFSLPTAKQAVQAVIFASGELIQSVEMGDPGAYAIRVLNSGEGIAVMPKGLSTTTMLTVRTDRRNYDFALTPADEQDVPLIVRFSYSAGDVGVDRSMSQNMVLCKEGRDPSCTMPQLGTYRQSGDASVRPFLISDDGARTFISFGEDQAVPAIFAVGPSGKEEMVDGYIRGGVYTLDRVYNTLVFRIDKDVAKAKRLIKRGRR
jgi:type IV secretion system protein VirB9